MFYKVLLSGLMPDNRCIIRYELLSRLNCRVINGPTVLYELSSTPGP